MQLKIKNTINGDVYNWGEGYQAWELDTLIEWAQTNNESLFNLLTGQSDPAVSPGDSGEIIFTVSE